MEGRKTELREYVKEVRKELKTERLNLSNLCDNVVLYLCSKISIRLDSNTRMQFYKSTKFLFENVLIDC